MLVAFGAVVAAATVVNSCRVKEDSRIGEPLREPEVVAVSSGETLWSAFWTRLLPGERALTVVSLDKESILPIASIGVTTCARAEKGILPLESVRWRIPIYSDLGRVEMVVEPRQEDPTTGLGEVSFKIGQVEGHFEGEARSAREMAEQACRHAGAGNQEPSPVSREQQEIVQGWLETVAPDCAFHASAEGWSCRLRGIPVAEAQEKVATMRRTLNSRWSNPPYALTRRLAYAAALSRIVANPDARRVAGFCRMVDDSLIEELPLIFRSRQWRDALCSTSPVQNVVAFESLATEGVRATIRELESLMAIGQSVSNSGLLVVEIDPSKGVGDSLRVKLVPDKRVMERLALEAVRERPKLERGESFRATATWHPAFREATEIAEIAEALNLTHGQSLLACAPPSSPEQSLSESCLEVGRYVALGVLSEVDFVVSNGRAKALRLPPGQYEFGVQDLSSPGPTSAVTGTLTWSAEQPKAEIRF
jgi:hypothetical protein